MLLWLSVLLVSFLLITIIKISVLPVLLCLLTLVHFLFSTENHFFISSSYHLSDIFFDLLKFGAEYLVMGGRLVYWLPIYRPEYVLLVSAVLCVRMDAAFSLCFPLGCSTAGASIVPALKSNAQTLYCKTLYEGNHIL